MNKLYALGGRLVFLAVNVDENPQSNAERK